MSAQLFFPNSTSRRDFKWHLLNLGTRSAYRCFPALSQAYLRRKLAPAPGRKAETPPSHFLRETISTPNGDIESYSVGEGPVVLFLHGWMGSGSQFFPTMEAVAASGYRAVTFDQYNHGLSKGSECNIPLLLVAAQTVIDRIPLQTPLAAVVSHSIGSAVALNSTIDRTTSHFMISPLFAVKVHIEMLMDRAGVDAGLLSGTLRQIEREYNFNFSSLDEEVRIAKLNTRIRIVHNRGDRISPLQASQKLAIKFKNVELNCCKGFSHSRLINEPETMNSLLEFLVDESA